MSLRTKITGLCRRWAVAALALELCFARAAGQDSNAPAPQAASPLVVRVSTELVQVDAVVTDKDGRYVTDLQASDFELSENGRQREITNFRYVPTASLRSPAPAAPGTPLAAATGPAPTRASTTRTLAIVIDDLSLSF